MYENCTQRNKNVELYLVYDLTKEVYILDMRVRERDKDNTLLTVLII